MTISTAVRPTDAPRVTTEAVPAASTDASFDRPNATLARWAGVACLVGVVLSVIGAVLFEVSTADLYGGLEAGSRADLAANLDAIAGSTNQLVVALSIWLLAFPTFAFGGVLLSRLGRPSVWTSLARYAFTAAAGAMPVFLVAMMTFVVVIAPAHAAGEDVLTLARSFGFAGSTLDWVISALALGIGPVAAVFAGRGTWAPRWLQRCAYVTAAITVVELLALAANNRDLTFVIVPAGLALTAASGVVALRHANRAGLIAR
jgi:hypothetical protein